MDERELQCKLDRLEALRNLRAEINRIEAQHEHEQDKELLEALKAWKVQIVHWHNQI
jgi:hypothetical protein